MVSFYFYMLFDNDKASPLVVQKARRDLAFNDYDDVRSNLPKFIEYLFEKQKRSRSPFQFTWAEFVRSWYDQDAASVKYEDLVLHGEKAFAMLLRELLGEEAIESRVAETVRKFSFAAQAGRMPGQEVTGSFLRKGVPGDWKEKFTRAAADTFDALAGEELRLLGYEPDDTWVSRLT